MEFAKDWLWLGWDAFLQLLTQPFYYISILWIAMFYRRQMLLERKLFSVSINNWIAQTLKTLIGGLAAGAAVSVVMVFLGSSLTLEAVICIWVTALILMLFRIRFLCFAYSIGTLGLIQFLLARFPGLQLDGWAGNIQAVIAGLDIPALLALAAVLHFAEAVLVKMQGANFATPLFLEGKRGKLVGGYHMQSFWPLPLFLLVPAAGDGVTLPWTPFFGDAWSGGAVFVALPVLIGFSEMTQSMLPKQKTAVTTKRLVVYSAALLLLSLLADWWSPLVVVAALTAILMHEGLVWFSRYEERLKSPLFVHPSRGLRVLAVLPGSPAEEMGILAGETILKVNGTVVHNKEQLHAALRQYSAFCKLEVQNHQGESKFMQRAIYAGEHHQLGAIIAPDPDGEMAVRLKPVSAFSVLGMKLNLKNRRAAAPAQAHPDTATVKDKPETLEI